MNKIFGISAHIRSKYAKKSVALLHLYTNARGGCNSFIRPLIRPCARGRSLLTYFTLAIKICTFFLTQSQTDDLLGSVHRSV